MSIKGQPEWKDDEKITSILINRIAELEERMEEQKKEMLSLIKSLKRSSIVNEETHENVKNLKNIWRLLRTMMEEWMTFTNWTGPSKILRTKFMFQRIIWIFLFFSFMGATIYVMVLTTTSYLSYSELTSIEFVWNVPVQFPTITICNLNPFFIKDLISSFSYQQLNNYSYYINSFGFNQSNVNSNIYFEMANYQKLFAAVKYNLSQTMYLAAQTQGLNSLISYFKSKTLSCSFLGEPCDFQNDFSVYTETENLFCFKYNSNISNTKNISKAGLANSFQFSFFLDSTSEVLTKNRGLRIYIHDQKRIYPVVFHDIKPGIETNIGLRQTNSQRLSEPYTNCIDELTSDNFKQTSVIQYMLNVLKIVSYTFKLCENIIFTNILKQNCSCMDKSYIMTDLPYICHTPSQIDCMNSFRNSYSADASEHCPIRNLIIEIFIVTIIINLSFKIKECTNVEYDKEITYSEYLTPWYADYVKNSIKPFFSNLNSNNEIALLNDNFPLNSSFDSIRQNIISFNIYFYDLNFNLISASSQSSWFILFANLAGICGGSFLGMSLLAIFEFLELCLLSIFYIVKFSFFSIVEKFKNPQINNYNMNN